MLRMAALLLPLMVVLPTSGSQSSPLVPATYRHDPSDLEVISIDPDKSTPTSIFLSRSLLASLPQVSTTLKTDENFAELPAEGARITGVDLGTLIHFVAPSQPSAFALAICRDGYTSPFPPQAVLDHHPILVLTMDGISPHAWAARHHTYDPSPYFVVYDNFVPSFQVLAHQDHAQHPAEIVRIKILPATTLLAPITPPDLSKLPADSPVLQGFRIAQQNCFRCHNSGETGGTKAQRTWQHLGEVAKSRPDFFADWVHDPQSLDPNSQMPPNLKYDQATLKALMRYFQTFAPEAN